MKARRLITSLLLVLCLMIAFPVPVSANSPEPSPVFFFYLSNLPQGTVYVDMLIPLAESDPMYEDMNRMHIPDGFAENAEILSCCEDGYRSYTFHYRNALSIIRVDRDYGVHFFTDDGFQTVRYDHADAIQELGRIRLAMLDSAGNILKVSPVLRLKAREFLAYMTGSFFYNGMTDEFRVDSATSGFGLFFYQFFVLTGLILTCIIERLVLVPFGLKQRYGKSIVGMNVVSQVLMHLGYQLFYSLIFWKYTYATILLEIAVYLGEYLILCRVMKDVPRRIRFAYTVAANTASFITGLLLFSFILF